ncbi:MAG: patatin-like phospholipase family protein, partial [Pseudomonadota bacterium]|nr:patatin-like phospholipase family protein [Pseudomonadota bacterium]
LMNELSVATKLMPNPLVLNRLKEAGRRAMDTFLADHRDDLGKRSTVDLAAMYG